MALILISWSLIKKTFNAFLIQLYAITWDFNCWITFHPHMLLNAHLRRVNTISDEQKVHPPLFSKKSSIKYGEQTHPKPEMRCISFIIKQYFFARARRVRMRWESAVARRCIQLSCVCWSSRRAFFARADQVWYSNEMTLHLALS
jgi:hypothetical protein